MYQFTLKQKKINIGVKYLILLFTEVSFIKFSQFALRLVNLDLYAINIGVKYLILFFTEASFNIFSQFALRLVNLELYTIKKYFYNCQQNN